jgi:hypothetical protein
MTAYGLSELAGKLSSVRFGCPKLLRCLEFQNCREKIHLEITFYSTRLVWVGLKWLASSQAVGEYMCSRRISEWAEGWLTAERCVRGDRPFNRNGIMLGGGLRYQW